MSLTKNRYPRYLNLRQLIYDAAEKYEDKDYLKYIKADKSIGEITFRRFSELVENLGTYFAMPESHCDRIAILAENRYEWIVAYAAAVCAGKTVIPLDKELAFEQVRNFMEFAEADTLIYSSAFSANVLSLADGETGIKRFISLDAVDRRTDNRFSSIRRCIAAGEEALALGAIPFRKLRTKSSRVCAILFTSGTTGTSKGVMLTEDNLLSCIQASANTVNIDEHDVLLSVLPFHHTYEMTCGVLTPICLGTTICINNSLKYFSRNLKIFRPTAMTLVPMFVSTLAKRIESEIEKSNRALLVKSGVFLTKGIKHVGIDLKRIVFSSIHKFLGGRLKTIICGGAALDPLLVKRFEEFGIYIAQGYGITECSPLVAVVPWKKVKYESVGLPVPGSIIKIMDEDDDGNETDLSVDEIGEICIKGPQVMAGYYKNPIATEEAFNREGFFKTGDFGYIDEDGYIFITGRKKNIIIFDNGKNVYPEEIEEYLYRINIIKECVVLARNVDGADMITAVIYPDYDLLKGQSEEQIKERFKTEVAAINRSLPSFKQIHHIEIKKTEFEKTSSKKIIRYKV